jgi:small subunit ribosomal protein S20
MANIKSAKKRIVTNEISRQRNVAKKSEIKTLVKKILLSVDSSNAQDLKSLLVDAKSKIDRAHTKGVLKKNTAARKVSKLEKKVAAALSKK